jgi:hypothetical protein
MDRSAGSRSAAGTAASKASRHSQRRRPFIEAAARHASASPARPVAGDQSALAGGVINFGTRYADGSGFLGLKTLDSSPIYGVRVVGGNLHFSNCYATA